MKNKIQKTDSDSFAPTPVARLVPQAPPMLLVDELTAWEPDGARAQAVMSQGGIFANAEGRLDPVVLVEMLAQLVAAQNGYEQIENGGAPRQGLLVGVKNFRLHAQPRAGDSFLLDCRKTFAMEQASLIEGSIHRGDTLMASGTLKIWEEEELPPPPTRPTAPAAATASEKAKERRHIPDAAWRISRSLVGQSLVESILKMDLFPNEVAATLRFRGDFPAFQGHFHNRPILPGVVMLQIAQVLAEAGAGKALDLTAITQAKFKQMIHPGQHIEARVRLKASDANGARAWQIRAQIDHEGKPVASSIIEATEAD